MQDQQKISYGSFKTMSLSHSILKAITHKGFKQPTPIQRKCFPILHENRDLVAMARTGSGKTVAYVVPMLEKLKAHSLKVGSRALILVPTRELALQIGQVVKELAKYTDLRFAMFVGGNSLDDQFSSLLSNPDILIATPGRILHLCEEVSSFSLKAIEFVVFDEADRLFELGLSEQVQKIQSLLPKKKQSCLFSATLPAQLYEFAKAGLNDPTLVRLDTESKISEDLDFFQFLIKPQMKEAFLLHLLTNVISRQEKTIIFVATKHHVEYLGELLRLFSFENLGVFGGMDQEARSLSLDKFRNGKVSILIVTDVASRGIDIPLLDNVINWDFPDKPKLFVHRVGRAGRAGRQGKAFSLVVMGEELPYLVELSGFLGKAISLGPFPRDNHDDQASSQDYRSSLILGSVPEHILDIHLESIKSQMQMNSDLALLARTAANGYKMYCKTKSTASNDAHRKAKELMEENGGSCSLGAIHPLLAANLDVQSLEQENILAAIRQYKSTATIFEIGKRNDAGYAAIAQRRAKIIPKGNSNNIPKVISNNIPKVNSNNAKSSSSLSRDDQNTNIKKESEKCSVIDSKKHQDPRFYLAYSSEESKRASIEGKAYSFDASSSTKSAIFDVNLDDPEALNRKQWDKRKGNFVKLRDHAHVAKRLKRKNGPIEAKGAFGKWKRKIGLELPAVGQEEIAASTLATLPQKGRDFRSKKPKRKINSNKK